MAVRPGVVRIAPPDRSDPRMAQWPWDLAWWFIPTGERDDGPGNYTDVPVRAFDEMAQKYMAERTVRPGQPLDMGGGRIVEVPYAALDDEADALAQRGGRPSPDRSDVSVRATDGTVVNYPKGIPRDFWEQLVVAHAQRRGQEPAYTIDFGDGRRLSVPFLWWDGICKDFMRNRYACLAAGYWPELIIREGIADPNNPGPLPMTGGEGNRGMTNAFGWGARPMTPQELMALRQQGIAAPGGMPYAPHPGEGEAGH